MGCFLRPGLCALALPGYPLPRVRAHVSGLPAYGAPDPQKREPKMKTQRPLALLGRDAARLLPHARSVGTGLGVPCPASDDLSGGWRPCSSVC